MRIEFRGDCDGCGKTQFSVVAHGLPNAETCSKLVSGAVAQGWRFEIPDDGRPRAYCPDCRDRE